MYVYSLLQFVTAILLQDLMNMLKEKNVTTDDVQLMDAASLLSYSHMATSLLPAYGMKHICASLYYAEC